MRKIITIIFVILMTLMITNEAFAFSILTLYFPPLNTTVPIIVLIISLVFGWKLKKDHNRNKLFIAKVAIVAIITIFSSFVVSVNLVDLYKAKSSLEKRLAYESAHQAIRNATTYLYAFREENKRYPATREELATRIPHALRPNIHFGYRLVSESIYEIITFHEKWKDIEFMMRNDSGTLFVRLTEEPNAQFKPEVDLDKLMVFKAASSPNIISEIWHKIIGRTKEMKVNVTVYDSDTKKPLWGAHVILGYHKKMKDSERSRIDENSECKGQTEGVTDKEGKINLNLKVNDCPTRGIESEGLFVSAEERDYAKYQRKVIKDKVDVALERLGYSAITPPLKIGYPKYQVDIEKYEKNFDLLNEMNSREIGDKLPIKSYFAWEYSHRESSGQEDFDDFLEKIEFIATVNGVPLLKEVLDKKYPLPYKRIKFKDDESWRSSDYVYEIGRKSVAKALLNISDTRTDDLLPASTDIPKAYLDVLSEYSIAVTAEDYWNYLGGKYVSRAHNPMIGMLPSSDPLLFVKSKMKERLTGSQYAQGLFKLYKTASRNGADEAHKKHYKWQIDQTRLAEDLFDSDLPEYTAEVRRLLPGMEANSTTRKYISYLYKQREYAYLAAAVKENKNLMKAFLAEDVKGIHSWNTTTKVTKDIEIEEVLLPKMPRVAERIRKEIEDYLIESSANYTFYRWWLRNMSIVNKQTAEKNLQDIYAEASVEPYKEHSKYEKQYALRGAAEGKLKGLCKTVYDDLQIKPKLKRDYFSIAKDRIYYLKSSCPTEFNKLVSTFNAAAVKERMAENKFEPNYGYDIKDIRESIWQGVKEYFPEKRSIKILAEYYGNSSSNTTSDGSNQSSQNKTSNVKRTGRDQEITDRTFQGLSYLVKGQERFASSTPIYEEKFSAFFLGSTSPSEKFKGNMIDWSVRVEPDKALPLLQQALNSQDANLVQAALYAFSFYPSIFSPDVTNKLKEHVSQGRYPEYLYAAHSIAVNNPSDESIRGICSKAADYHLNIVERRDLSRFDHSFAFNILLTLNLCAQVKDEQTYGKVLNAIFERNSVGRYELFQKDIERIITSNSIPIDQLIEKLTKSSDVVDNILGIRLAELKKHQVDSGYLEEKLNHDDSYVRLATAKYIIENKEKYSNLYKSLSNNTNRKVRDMAMN